MSIVAHRGFSAVAPENTLASLRLAIEAGAQAVEFDIQESKDGVPFMIHDYTLGRTTNGKGRVSDHLAWDLRLLDAGSWFSPEFAGERLVSLDKTLAFLKPYGVPIYLEMKAGLSRNAVSDVAQLLGLHGLTERTTVISFDWLSLHLLRLTNPAQRVGVLVHNAGEYDGAVLRAADLSNAIVDCNYRLLLEDPTRVEFARRHGIDLAVYTVNEVSDARQLREMGVKGLTTNEVAKLVEGLR